MRVQKAAPARRGGFYLEHIPRECCTEIYHLRAVGGLLKSSKCCDIGTGNGPVTSVNKVTVIFVEFA
jgi:hypothetical protein